MKAKYKWFLTALGMTFFILRLWHIEFGLPHSFYADEPEIAEPAIKYTYEIRDIIKNNNWYKLVPTSFVYGTFPTYLFTIKTIVFSKTLGILGITFQKMHLYILMRSITAFMSFLIIPIVYFLYQKVFKDKEAAVAAAVLTGFNWKLIVHAHYVNADIIITLLLLLSYLTLYLYYEKKKPDVLYSLLTGILFGLAVGTKITVLLTLPLYVYVFIKKKNVRNLVAFLFLIFGAFVFSNPFSIVFANDFAYRIYSMLFKEGGMVFDSVDSNPFKYLVGLSYMVTLPVFLISLYGKYKSLSKNKDKTFHMFLIGQVVLYLVFYSLQSRRVDRWLLPILPIALIYATYGTIRLKEAIGNKTFLLLCGLSCVYYLYFPGLLLFQFQRNTPKSASYIWLRENTAPTDWVLAYTEEGLDPLNKLPYGKVKQLNVYASESAQFLMPEDPSYYNYVVISSRPMTNHKRKEVRSKYPFYYEAWNGFEDAIYHNGKFELVKSFALPKPNLIPLSDVYVYKNLDRKPFPAISNL